MPLALRPKPGMKVSPCNPITNILTIDLEDYFQVSVFESVVRREEWDKYESRIERNTHRLLEILSECKPNVSTNVTNEWLHTSNLQPESLAPHDTRHSTLRTPVRATFFCLGWIAERYPDLIREIHQQGHEIACHGYAHKLIYNQSMEEFTEDIRKAKAILEDIIGEEVIGYRAPSYSITKQSEWAFEVLMEEGFEYDSSIFPIHHDRYGIPGAPRFPFVVSMNGTNTFEFKIMNVGTAAPKNCSTAALINSTNSSNPMNPSNQLIEFPISTVRFLGQNVPISGGGYFRLFPYPMAKMGLRNINDKEKRPFVFYLHPWEMDPEQPRIQNGSFKSHLRHYINLSKTERKLKRLLKDFNFTSLRDILRLNEPDKPDELDKPK
jgi:polysaccharide deacetylase family protein (PEP-CTERM system associated)